MADDIFGTLAKEAFLYPPMEPFESPFPDAQKAMSAVLAKCSALSGAENWHGDGLKSWLSKIRLRHDIAFYGAALNATAHAKDIDILRFPSRSLPPTWSRPDYIHIFDVFEASQGELPGYAATFLSGALLFPEQPETSLLLRIEAERRVFERLPFFIGGLGETLTYAAFKATESISAENAQDPNFQTCMRFRIERQWLDGANMRMVVHTPHGLNEQIRDQMRELQDPEVRALAMAAMRRLRVKESSKAALADRFVSELRCGNRRG